MKKNIIILILCILVCSLSQAYAQEYQACRAIIGVNSNISAGAHSIQVLAERVKEKDLQLVILTDHLLVRAEYGLFPWRRLIKKVKEQNSILYFGLADYLELIKQANNNFNSSGVLIIPGCDLAPFYYYTGSPFTEDLVVYNFSKQLLVVGLNSLEDWRNLPVMANVYKDKQWGLFSLVLLWPAAFIFLGMYFLTKRIFHYQDNAGQELAPYSAGFRVLGGIIIMIGILFFINNFPFHLPDEFNPYAGDKGLTPYQRAIDYVSQRGGLVFWSMPEAGVSKQRIGYATMVTKKDTADLSNTDNYTGFGALDGTVSQPAKQWDELLNQYCRGSRAEPVWAVGEADYQGGNTPIDGIQTILLMPELSQEAAIEALSKGRMYALRKSPKTLLELEYFLIKNPETGKVALMGEELLASEGIELEIKVSYQGVEQALVQLRLVKNGEVVRTVQTKEPVLVFRQEERVPEKKRSYYRLLIDAPGSRIISNPIFIQRQEN